MKEGEVTEKGEVTSKREKAQEKALQQDLRGRNQKYC